ncbi:uncharacterized protein LOC133180175 [Saccostrea echinata]|uniref:uncharacterized protein LOC133180175 n=1 Tax=Saccostrea echinata TaxID=191078 RepID=UPI002A811644|nr:uncharacterized protein LOC133180175 [Saccostrea echinata]
MAGSLSGRKSYNEDLSRSKTTSQSKTWECVIPACMNYYISSNAVDRNEKTCARSTFIGEGATEKTVWWKVDMGDIYSIYSIDVLFENMEDEARQRGRFAGFSLYLSESGKRDNDSLCYKNGQDVPPLNFTTTCIGYGRYVFFYNERLDGVDYPPDYKMRSLSMLCEVIVKGCNKTFYGKNCEKKCSVNCEDQRCNIVNGTCMRCSSGWTGQLCKNSMNVMISFSSLV